jgi:hypothetical protein
MAPPVLCPLDEQNKYKHKGNKGSAEIFRGGGYKAAAKAKVKWSKSEKGNRLIGFLASNLLLSTKQPKIFSTVRLPCSSAKILYWLQVSLSLRAKVLAKASNSKVRQSPAT